MAYTNIDDPSAYFQTALHTSANAATITNDGNSNLQPDLIWSKARGAAHNHGLYDSTRGVTKFLNSNTTSAEGTASAGFDLISFDTNGFSTGNNQFNTICGGTTYVAWQWKANGGTTSTDTNGSINSTVQVNQDAGFSIVTYTGTGSTADQTIGHGLGVRANAVIVKNRDGAANWVVYVDGLTANHCMELNTLDTESDSTQGRVLSNAGTRGTSTIFSIRSGSGSVIQTNTSGEDYVAYCFASKQGYSKFGKYIGNGHSGGDGTFVYTGFAPRFVMIKRTDGANDWILHDYKLGTLASTGSEKGNVGNVNSAALRANETSTTDDWGSIDMLSNGFKARSDAASVNASGGSYIYMAFAEHPFTTSTGIPTTAR
ncbi:hypothetical protein N9D94_07590 [Gammaproteobacteria bacterium]|nr:hypothetical protein [Gammaproteobacteria bacterium]